MSVRAVNPVSPSTIAWPREGPASVRWRVWPLVDRPRAALLVLLGLAGAGATIHAVTAQPNLVGLSLAALGIALWRFFIPVWFELDGQGVHQSVLRRRRLAWTEIGQFEVRASGVLLLPMTDPRPIDAIHGLYLPWGPYRDEVLATIRYHLPTRST